jgi:hypothetical protein
VLALGAGVVGASVASAAPTITINEPDAREYAAGEAITVDFECAPESEVNPVLGCSATLDGTPIADGATVTPDAGSHVFRVEGSDALGNSESQVNFTVAAEGDPPTGGTLNPPAATRSAQIAVNATAASDASPPIEYAIIEGGGTPTSFGGLPTTFTLSAGDGAKSLALWARDAEGNQAVQQTRVVTLDSTPPAAPGLTGPPALTRDVTPTHTWSGEPGGAFSWSLVRDGGATIATGSGPGTSHTSGALSDGAYTFTVTQSDAVGPGAAATRRFTVDSTAPDAPTVTARPPATGTDRSPVFAWTASEAGPATFTWRLLRAGDGVAEGPTDTLTNRVTLSVQPGSYTFQVSQTDAVGNAGAYGDGEAFTVETVRDPEPPEPPKDPVVDKNEKPKVMNARRMKPRAGARFASVRPTLRWTKRRGAVLYNIQIFRVNAEGVTKVVTAFPRTTWFKVPGRRLKAGKTYVWRVWPYMSRSRASKKPLGISYFRVTAARRR